MTSDRTNIHRKTCDTPHIQKRTCDIHHRNCGSCKVGIRNVFTYLKKNMKYLVKIMTMQCNHDTQLKKYILKDCWINNHQDNMQNGRRKY